MSDHTNLKTTPDWLHASNRLRGEPGSFQDALHHDAQMAHYFRSVLERLANTPIRQQQGEEMALEARKALGFIIGQGEPFLTPDGRTIHQNAD